MKLINLFYKLNGIRFGRNFRLRGFPILYAKKRGSISFGNDVVLNSSILSNLIGLYQRTIIIARTPEAVIHIGDNVGISGATIYARKEIFIGSHCRIGANVKILDNDFHPVDPEKRLVAPNKLMNVKPIRIGENVFIGVNSIILKGVTLKGVTIGDNTTIGAGSVVSSNIPANCVAAGNPARVIKNIEKK